MSDKSDKVKSEVPKSEKPKSETGKKQTEKVQTGKVQTEKVQTGKVRPENKNPVPKLSISLSHALLLVAVILFGIGVYLWTEVMQLKYMQQNILAKANKTSMELVQQEIKKVNKNLQDIRKKYVQSSKTTIQTLDKLGRSVNELQKITGREKQGWKLAEAAFLLAAANHSVRLKRDLETALFALNEADQRLKEANDPKFLDIRKKIATEISQLKSVKSPDIDGMIVTLDSISRQAKTLALFASIPVDLKKKAELMKKTNLENTDKKTKSQPPRGNLRLQLPDSADVKSVLGSIWKELKTLVVVHHYDKSVPKLLLPEQEVAMRQVLDLKLQQARIVLLKGEEKRYRIALKSVSAWLLEHFDTNDTEVKNVMQSIDALSKQKVIVAIPDISGSLRQMRRFLNSNSSLDRGNTQTNKLQNASKANKDDKTL